MSRASKYLKYGGWIGTAIGGGAAYMKVQDVCTAGDAQACKRVKFTEGGGFAGGIAGGVVAGSLLTAPAVAGLCVLLGAPTAGIGTVVCGVAVVGVGSLTSGIIGGIAGELAGDVIYEVVK